MTSKQFPVPVHFFLNKIEIHVKLFIGTVNEIFSSLFNYLNHCVDFNI